MGHILKKNNLLFVCISSCFYKINTLYESNPNQPWSFEKKSLFKNCEEFFNVPTLHRRKRLKKWPHLLQMIKKFPDRSTIAPAAILKSLLCSQKIIFFWMKNAKTCNKEASLKFDDVCSSARDLPPLLMQFRYRCLYPTDDLRTCDGELHLI